MKLVALVIQRRTVGGFNATFVVYAIGRDLNRRWGNRRYHLLFGFTPFWEIAPDETN